MEFAPEDKQSKKGKAGMAIRGQQKIRRGRSPNVDAMPDEEREGILFKLLSEPNSDIPPVTAPVSVHFSFSDFGSKLVLPLATLTGKRLNATGSDDDSGFTFSYNSSIDHSDQRCDCNASSNSTALCYYEASELRGEPKKYNVGFIPEFHWRYGYLSTLWQGARVSSNDQLSMLLKSLSNRE